MAPLLATTRVNFVILTGIHFKWYQNQHHQSKCAQTTNGTPMFASCNRISIPFQGGIVWPALESSHNASFSRSSSAIVDVINWLHIRNKSFASSWDKCGRRRLRALTALNSEPYEPKLTNRRATSNATSQSSSCNVVPQSSKCYQPSTDGIGPIGRIELASFVSSRHRSNGTDSIGMITRRTNR